jgi:hypothetical protein
MFGDRRPIMGRGLDSIAEFFVFFESINQLTEQQSVILLLGVRTVHLSRWHGSDTAMKHTAQ